MEGGIKYYMIEKWRDCTSIDRAVCQVGLEMCEGSGVPQLHRVKYIRQKKTSNNLTTLDHRLAKYNPQP